MNYSIITTKVDPITKKAAQKVAEELGIPLSVIIKGYVRQLIRTKTVRFSVEDEIPNKRTIALMKQAQKNLKKGNHSPIFDTGEAAVAWLEKQGI